MAATRTRRVDALSEVDDLTSALADQGIAVEISGVKVSLPVREETVQEETVQEPAEEDLSRDMIIVRLGTWDESRYTESCSHGYPHCVVRYSANRLAVPCTLDTQTILQNTIGQCRAPLKGGYGATRSCCPVSRWRVVVRST